MKNLLIILIAAALLFMGLAILQEWSVFEPFFKGDISQDNQEPAIPPEVGKTVDHFNTVMVHYYRFNGDQRFLDRLPAGKAVKARFAEDSAYLKQFGVIQDMKNVEFTVQSMKKVSKKSYEVLTREKWQMIYRDVGGEPLVERPMTFQLSWRYLVHQGSEGWIVAMMEPVDEF